MSTILPTSQSLILVTGATGYIAAWVCRILLERGHNVRGTVRSEAKGKQLVEEFSKRIAGYRHGQFDFVIVSDISEPGAFDEAVKGVDAVQHVASPILLDASDPNEVIGPAVNGTVGILESVKKFGEKVKRVVITSSAATIMEILPEAKVFNEDDWNEQSIREVEERGKDVSNSMVKYWASKTLAEKAAWRFMKENPDLTFDLVAIHPTLVFGPVTTYISTPENLGYSAGEWYTTVMTFKPDAAGRTEAQLSAKYFSWVDVRDVAEAHARAMEREEASGRRIIVSVEASCWQDWLDVANTLTPAPYTKHPLARGVPGCQKDGVPHAIFENKKARDLLGMSVETGATRGANGEGEWKYRTKEETTKDILVDFAQRGW
ncbi:hypothetical protein VNI00_017808 [Paramarasmius palmivorus]|uniref:NAD-dependent epimerase/dehydratase domain-containing protein n=1 Tax=Paramarasmius palmivorus TaxID=297713 RepID=A0AAW0B691_9AGAR